MEIELLYQRIHAIVNEGNKLKKIYIKEKNPKIDSCYIFAHSIEEYDKLEECTKKIGRQLNVTATGNIYQIPAIETECGILRILKIRIPDITRSEMGCVDFVIEDFDKFKRDNLSKDSFKLIQRENYEMIELMDKEYNARVYFPNPPAEILYKLL